MNWLRRQPVLFLLPLLLVVGWLALGVFREVRHRAQKERASAAFTEQMNRLYLTSRSGIPESAYRALVVEATLRAEQWHPFWMNHKDDLRCVALYHYAHAVKRMDHESLAPETPAQLIRQGHAAMRQFRHEPDLP